MSRLLTIIIFSLLHKIKCDKCWITNLENKSAVNYSVENCAKGSYCCEYGCCSPMWYSGPLVIFFTILLLLVCFVTCLAAYRDTYNENINYATVTFRVHPERVTEGQSPPPRYSVAIFLPQPSNSVPSYEEAMGHG